MDIDMLHQLLRDIMIIIEALVNQLDVAVKLW